MWDRLRYNFNRIFDAQAHYYIKNCASILTKLYEDDISQFTDDMEDDDILSIIMVDICMSKRYNDLTESVPEVLEHSINYFRKNNKKEYLIMVLKKIDPDRYKLEIKSLEKQL